MKKSILSRLVGVAALALCAVMLMGASGCRDETSDDVQQKQQEKILAEGTSQIGMPAIKNFRERKILKDIIELRDQSDYITFTYFENQNPTVIPGHTALGGKLTFLGQSIGYGIPYATQFTNPQKALYPGHANSTVLPQADPNGLFSPASAEGTWVMLKDPNGTEAKTVYIEPRIVVSPFKFPMD